MRFRLWMMAAMGVALAAPVRADYFAIDLNDVGIQPTAVNANRQFAGTANQQAYRWDSATGFTYLGTLGGTSSSASAVNAGGSVAGISRVATNSGSSHAFLWQAGVGLTDLGTLGGTASPTVAGINVAGFVVGASPTAGNAATHAFLWQPGVGMTDLGTLGGNNSRAAGVNDSGVVAGTSNLTGGGQRPFVWTQAGGLVDLGGLGGSTSNGFATGINNAGTVIGQSDRGDGTAGAFVYQNGAFTDLGTLGGSNSTAFGINDAGVVVGSAQNAAGEDRAFIWDAANGLRDLTDLLGVNNLGNTVLNRAVAITSRGEILAHEDTADGVTIFLVTDDPDLTPPVDVPAPPALLLMSVGLPLVALIRRWAAL